MCGIAATLELGRPDGGRLLTSLMASVAARGPDDFGTYSTTLPGDVTVSLGHRRLSVIDTSSGGHQPMEREGTTVTFNGEIYNYIELRKELADRGHRFTTGSDTEVLIQAYRERGIACFQSMRGMFAAAILDPVRQELVLVRDRFGVKPIYWARTTNGVAVASTSDALARALDLAPSWSYLRRGLQDWVYEDDSSAAPFEGVQAVPAGCALRISLIHPFATTATRWYDLKTELAAREDEGAAADPEELRALIDDAVALRLRSDVPVASTLSGGLDSAIVAASAGSSVRAFCYGAPHQRETEGEAARRTAEALGLDVVWVNPTSEEFADAIVPAIQAQGSPFPDPSIVAQFLVCREVKSAGYSVLLGGQGADEVFLGYRKFQARWISERLRRRDAGRALVDAVWLSFSLAADRAQWRQYWAAGRRYWGPATSGERFISQSSSELHDRAGEHATAQQWATHDVLSTSLPTLLRYEDRNSMAWGVETRLPFVDHRLVEYGLSRRPDNHIRRGYGKWDLRESANGVLPDDVRLARKKRGFDASSLSAMTAGGGRQLREMVTAALPLLNDASIAVPKNTTDYFSDRRLGAIPHVFAEAISLAWWSLWA
jgi:asparagine synthase (glutamine-hydrolysing)